jgi:hypothetical protein
VVLLSTVFKFKTRDSKVRIFLGLALFNYAISECFKMFGQQTTEGTEDERSSLKPILRAKAVHFWRSLFLPMLGLKLRSGVGHFFVSEGINLLRILGWIVTFMLDVRGGGPSSGYVSSGFFSGRSPLLPETRELATQCKSQGLMLGRVALLWVTSKVECIPLSSFVPPLIKFLAW